MRRLAILVISLGLLSGCAVGVKHDYSSPRPRLDVSNAAKLSVGTQDRRPYVLEGQKDPNFAGLSRGGYGNTFDIGTASGAPLADDFSTVIAETLKAKGIQADVVRLLPNTDRKTVDNALFKTASSKAILITLYAWKTDTYANTILIYDAKIEVLSRNGAVLAQNAIKGSDNLGGGKLNMAAHSRAVTPEAFRKKLEQLLNDPNIVKALQ